MRELAQQRTGPARVVQVHVRQQQVVHRAARDAELIQRRQQIGHGEVGADIDEGGAPAIHDQVCGRVSRVQVLGIDGGDAIGMMIETWLHGNVRPVTAGTLCDSPDVHIVTRTLG